MLPLRERVGGAGGPPSIRACVRACAQCTRAGVRVSRNACLHADVSKVFLHTLYWMGMDHPAKSTILPAWVRAGRWRPYEGEHAHCTLARTTPCTGPVCMLQPRSSTCRSTSQPRPTSLLDVQVVQHRLLQVGRGRIARETQAQRGQGGGCGMGLGLAGLVRQPEG